MLSISRALFLTAFTARSTLAYNFLYEGVQLEDGDVANNSDIAFGKLPGSPSAKCKTFPGDSHWPSSERWDAFNASLGGALVRGIPPAAACYEGPYEDAARCEVVRTGSRSSNFVKEDPVIPFQQWTLGNPCPVPASNQSPGPEGACNISSYPAFAVVASTVKHVQLAVNFARNNNIRLTIKNTGHDFVGRNTGGGALQVYVHPLKAFEFLPSVQIAQYQGRAARVGAALEQYDLVRYQGENNVTILTPGSTTVGALGGYMQGGGFGYLTSKFGLMVDQVLSLEVVTADGRFVHADPGENEDLFWAIRGGGPSNFGIVTSAVIKAHDPVSVTVSSFNLRSNSQLPADLFWEGVNAYFSHLVRINDAKGIGWNNIGTQPPVGSAPRSFTFTGQVTMPGMSADEMSEFMAPIIKDINNLGINISNPKPDWWPTFAAYAGRVAPGEGVGNGRMGSRLFPRSNFVDTSSTEFNATMAAIRSWVEDGGYSFHSVDYHPSLETAGYPGTNSAANPHLRTAIMHATGFDTGSYGPGTTPEQQISQQRRLMQFAQKWRDASPTSGAYMNEANTEEPNFQEAFYGGNYEKLLEIKRKRDPWGAFYAVTGVGSDEWVVEGTSGLPTQQGRLCRV
ncbi:FAD/FMN-containing isoamyl alcohol oxidase-like protein MreA [Lentithecium fluviatile CBS 122367]|uniref:FAD/FMN-containing isoamyl alcohol oxidase-like protein MreA n=1 Tax=Lentithecium fluviatile CBS 122367 TaxID=1168545 RepID=A0A6G1IJM4_9PLEO|nr:FAD/FMN-containing isoamyl alcohol oxidase-like protein MreA [Lentithecium fluviatile CBS 122367]